MRLYAPSDRPVHGHTILSWVFATFPVDSQYSLYMKSGVFWFYLCLKLEILMHVVLQNENTNFRNCKIFFEPEPVCVCAE